jgi:hypothetical protein
MCAYSPPIARTIALGKRHSVALRLGMLASALLEAANWRTKAGVPATNRK